MPNDMPQVVTRFAPSPTGFLHIGGARTALFNWLYARRHGGTFLLRIEDTDRERSTDVAVAAILAGLKWLGLDWDGEAVSQYERSERHRQVAERLLAEGKAYPCYATPEELQAAREAARAAGQTFRGDLWRDREPPADPDRPHAVRLKMPREGSTIIEDRVQGRVEVSNDTLDDMILLRSDGTPTYMLAVVVDDHDMGVTHVVRGDDHLNNAFRQHQLYNALGWTTPAMAHIPLIHGPDGKKLSKRHGALGVEAYRDMGYLPEAMRNYLLRLGWSRGDAEIISTAEAKEWFDLEGIGRGASRFDFDKLGHLNHHYMQGLSSGDLLHILDPYLVKHLERRPIEAERARVIAALPDLVERAQTLDALAGIATPFCNSRPLVLDDKTAGLLAKSREALTVAHSALAATDIWSEDAIRDALKAAASSKGLKMGQIMQPVRAAMTGGKPAGDLAGILVILGRDEVLARLSDQLA
ncbi:glutamate--tRNA ligase [Eilatimonas milleporae]|uniref:Glutamate--tRNA ligase n=1 Tax=Eilatimonas milleporae TaxID=911205 RepID=A0A3M0CGQ8_9PROT|nr:glutamate--tRNA ligase [Eilatimonas milleporae]RMB08804.1 glutamyl-tRNA synthetase [Eilatimonas milleporae]